MQTQSSQALGPEYMRKPGSRLFFVDLFRLFAIFLMVQGHVFRALANDAIQKGLFWRIHETVHGLTAPLFLFGSGMIFMVVTRGRWDEYRKFGAKTWQRLRRYIYFLVIGYWLHLPSLSLSKTIRMMNPELLARMTAVDVLHIISIGLILLHLICMLLGRPRRAMWLLLPLGVACLALAPLVRPLNLPGPSPLVSWLTTQYGSNFTILPWWGYILFGACFGILFPESGKLKDERRYIIIAIISGVACFIIGFVVSLMIGRPFGIGSPNKPEQVLANIGGVLLVISIAWLLERVGFAKKIRKAFFLSEETLIVYVIHLMLLYGSVLSPGIATFIGPTLGMPMLLLVFTLISALTVAFTWGWHWVKKENLKVLRIIQLAMTALFIITYLVSPV